MNNIITPNQIKTLTSIEVSTMVNKEHSKLLKDVRRCIKQLGEAKIGFTDFFKESTYISEQNKELPCFNITRKGCEFIANKLTGQKGTEFTARYVNRFHELEEGNITNTLISTLKIISDSMINIQNNITNLKSDIETRLTKLENQMQSQPAIENTYKKPYNPWFVKMQPKYKLLEDYFDITRGKLYHNILLELENLYDIDTQQIQADYCYENNISSCYPLEPYEFVPKYRDMIEQIVNSNLIKYGIASEDDPIASTRHMIIFDIPVNQ
jgi:toxin-antitoxin system, toxin component, bro family